MLTYSGRLQGVLKNHQAVYSFICIGITSSLIFWPLLSSIFCGLLFIYWLFVPGKKFSIVNGNSRKLFLFGALYVPVIIGFAISSNTGEAAFFVQQKIPLLLFPVVFGSLPILTPLLKKKIFWTLIFSTTIACWLGLSVGLANFIVNGSADRLHGYDLVVLMDMHPAVFGLCCLLSIGYLLEEIKRNGREMDQTVRLGTIATVAFLMLFLWLIGNRSSLISLTIISLIYIFRIFRSLSRRLLGVVVLAGIWACSLVAIPALNSRVKELVNQPRSSADVQASVAFPDSKTARLQIWQSVIQVVGNNWILGVGTGDSQAELDKSYNKKNCAFATFHHCNAHNQYLQETVAFGIPGLIIFLLCLLVPFYSYLHSKDHALYCVFLLVFAIVCMSESILQLSKGIILYSFFNALFAFGLEEHELPTFASSK